MIFEIYEYIIRCFMNLILLEESVVEIVDEIVYEKKLDVELLYSRFY